MPRGIPNKPKKKATKKVAKKIVKKTSNGRRKKTVALADVVNAARDAGAKVEIEIESDTQNQAQAASSNDDRIDAAALGRALHEQLAESFAATDTRIAFGGNTAVGKKVNLIQITRNGVNRAVTGLINATVAYNNCNNTYDEPVLRAELDLANARYQRAMNDFQRAIEG